MNDSSITQAKNDVERNVDWLARAICGYRDRLQAAADVGLTLAQEVYAYAQDPDGVGTDRLEAAYAAFMGQHAGGFAAES